MCAKIQKWQNYNSILEGEAGGVEFFTHCDVDPMDRIMSYFYFIDATSCLASCFHIIQINLI